MEKPWEKPVESREEARGALSPTGATAHICWWLGGVFAVVGIIGDAANITLGLEPTSWLLLAIAAFVASIFPSLGWAVPMHLLGIGGQSSDE